MAVAAEWMPVSVRPPHTVEILADEFVYAGVLVVLLMRGVHANRYEPRPVARSVTT